MTIATVHAANVRFDADPISPSGGFNGPIQVVIQVPTPADRVAATRVHDALQSDAGVASVTAPIFNAAGDTAILTANPETGPQDPGTDALVHHLRSDVLPATVQGTGAKALLTGQALVTDLTEDHVATERELVNA
jgi:putative drug exporter of the RND superfamily